MIIFPTESERIKRIIDSRVDKGMSGPYFDCTATRKGLTIVHLLVPLLAVGTPKSGKKLY